MPLEDGEKRKPPRGLNNDHQTLLEVTEALFESGEFIGTVRGHERYRIYFDRAIGYRIDLEGNQLLLYFAEMKIIKGEYHVIPRTKPSKVI